MAGKLNQKVVIITGASSGIGLAMVYAFASQGCRLVLASRQEDKLQKISTELTDMGVENIWVKTDISLETDCRHLIESAVNKFHRIDVLVNNAGISMRALFGEAELEVLRRLMDTNFWGAVYCSHYALPYIQQSKGSIVGISSIAGKKGLPGRSGYSASKFALEGFLETIRIENLKKDVHVLVACPGFTASNIRNTALAADGQAQKESPRDEKKMMSAREVAEEIVRAVMKRKRDLVLTPQGKLTVSLNKFFPAWVDKLVFSHMAKEKDSPLKP